MISCFFLGVYFYLYANVSFRIQKRITDHFQRQDEVLLNEEELRQMATRTYETSILMDPNNAKAIETNKTSTTPAIVVNEKSNKPDQRNDGTLSDSILSTQPESSKKRRPSMSSKAFVILGLSKKANSSSSIDNRL